MPDSSDILVKFLELLEIQPPILQAEDKSSLEQLLEKLDTLEPHEIQEASAQIIAWGEKNEPRVRLYQRAKLRSNRKELDENIAPDPHKDRWIIPNFELETSKNEQSETSELEVRILITPPPKTNENPPERTPLLDYLKQRLRQWIQ